jgi:LPXTG-site transpeptidase (sortase) family protein
LWSPLKVSNLLIGLGLLLILVTAISGLGDARQTASPFDQVESADQSSKGFDPIIIPEATLVDQQDAPTLLPQTSNPQADSQIILPTSVAPSLTPLTRMDSTVVKNPPLTATPAPIWIPDRIVIPVVKLDAPAVPAMLKEVAYQGKLYQQLVAPDSFDAGWFTKSATLGVAGNTVLIGHHNYYGEVFAHLVDLQVGDLILVYSGDKSFAYAVKMKMILPELGQPLEVRLKNAQWVAASHDERLTLVTCWPANNNTHRLVIVAMPVSPDTVENYEMVPRPTSQPPKTESGQQKIQPYTLRELITVATLAK